MRGLPGRVLWSVGVFGLGLCSLISYTHISGSVALPCLLSMVTWRRYGATCLLPPDEVKTRQRAHPLIPHDWLRVSGLLMRWGCGRLFFTVAVQSLLLLVRLCGLYPLSLFSFDQSPPLQTHDRQRLTPHQAYQDKAHVFVQNGTTKSHSYTLKQLF